jgi:predicted lipoprotein with Yx(FWY)xxD motif
MKNFMRLLSIKLLLAIFGLATIVSCSDDDDDTTKTEESAKILLVTNTTLGKILTDQNNVTLYFFSKDASGASACLDGCLNSWPIFYAENAEIGAGLVSTDFSTITHSNGEKQTAYKGWPLYYYSPSKDGVKEAANATGGEGIGSVWFVAKPDYTIMLASAQLVGSDTKNYTSNYDVGEGSTSFFVDGKGRTLYTFSKDFKNVNKFTNSDFSNDGAWPVFTESLASVASTLSKEDFGSIDVFGKTQLTYKGWPLYYFGQDAERGQTKGVSVPAPGVWPVVNSSVAAATDEPVAASATITLTTNTTLGEIITDSEGRTLYFFSKDVSGAVKCAGGCLNNWPIFYTADIVISNDALSASDFKNIEQDGIMITTYKGWPLYYYSSSGDGVKEAAGATGGDGIGGVWYVAKKNYGIMIAKSQLIGSNGTNYLGDYSEGTGETIYFTDGMGRTLYTFQNDTKNDNNFTNSDFSNDGSWPIFHASVNELPSGANAVDFGEIDVFGKKQLTFKGWPVYYYGGDATRGQNKGVSVPTPGKWPIINNNVVAAQ